MYQTKTTALQCDNSGKEIVINLLETIGLGTLKIENISGQINDSDKSPSQFGVDLQLTHLPSGQKRFIDAEVSGGQRWITKDVPIPYFKYDTLHIPDRKSKFMNEETYFAFCHEEGKLLYLLKSSLCPKYQMTNTDCNTEKGNVNQWFFDVPLKESCKIYLPLFIQADEEEKELRHLKIMKYLNVQ